MINLQPVRGISLRTPAAGHRMNDGWYYGADGNSIGPLTVAQLVAFLREQPDWQDVPVWHARLGDWRTAGGVQGIASALNAVPAKTSPPPKRPAWIVVAAVAGLVLLVAAGGAWWLMQPSSLEQDISKVIAAARPTLPKTVEDGITLVDVTAAGTRLTYRHVIDPARYSVPGNFSARMKAQILPGACAAIGKDVLKAGGSAEYEYRSRSAFYVGSFVLTGADC